MSHVIWLNDAWRLIGVCGVSHEGVRAHTVWGTWRGWHTDLCQHLQHTDQSLCSWQPHKQQQTLPITLVLCSRATVGTASWQLRWGHNIFKARWQRRTMEQQELLSFIERVQSNHMWDISILVRCKWRRRAQCDDDNAIVFHLSHSLMAAERVLLVTHGGICAFYKSRRHELIMSRGVDQWALYRDNFTAIKATAITINKVVRFNEPQGRRNRIKVFTFATKFFCGWWRGADTRHKEPCLGLRLRSSHNRHWLVACETFKQVSKG